MTGAPRDLTGALLVDKPSGPTSHDVVAFARRLLHTSRVGHTGTLDPLATGLLVLLIGPATRLARFVSADEKEYLADVRLGVATPTYDAQSLSAVGSPPSAMRYPRPAEIDAVLDRFRGTFLQTPPPYSAKKVAGVAAYEKARKNEAVDLQPVQVTVRELHVLSVADSGERPPVIGQRTADGGQQIADSGQQIADSGQRTADGGQREADSGQRTADGGQREADSGQRTADGGQRSADGGQQIADSGQRTADGGQREADGGQQIAHSGQRSADRDRSLVRLCVVGSAGFYVRSLAHDLGQALGCGAHLEALRRTRAGRFRVEDAATLDTLQALGPSAVERVLPVDGLLGHLPAVTATDAGRRRAENGNPLRPGDLEKGARAGSEPFSRVLDAGGETMAVAEWRADGLLHPVVVLR